MPKVLLLLLLSLVTTLVQGEDDVAAVLDVGNNDDPDYDARIVGGKYAEEGQFPYQVRCLVKCSQRE